MAEGRHCSVGRNQSMKCPMCLANAFALSFIMEGLNHKVTRFFSLRNITGSNGERIVIRESN